MLSPFRFAPWIAAAAWLFAAPAAAADEAFELWFNPSISHALDDNTGVEFETAQRLRSEADGRADTYYARLWVNQDLSEAITLSGGVERRINAPGADETRLLQQASTRHGIVRNRNRLEQRFVDGGRMGLRLRSRLGVDVPLGENSRWAIVGNAELFLTLRSTSAGGDDGLTGLRTQIAVAHEVNDRLSVSLGYLRQQAIEEGGPDEVGHAPIIGAELSF